MEIKKLLPPAVAASICATVVAVALLPNADLRANAANAGQPAAKQLASKGAPPDGTYNCCKISGSSLINLGTLEIKGKTYRGLVAEGAFHAFTMDASGNITYTNGLAGMPEGWKLTTSEYTGPDEAGHPLIKVRYISKSGNHEEMDAVKEK